MSASPEREHLFDLDADALAAWCVARDLPRFTARQILGWVYERGVLDPQRMTDLSKAARTRVAEELRMERGTVVRHQVATDGTQKLLVDWSARAASGDVPLAQLQPSAPGPDRRTECVMITADPRRTACLSSQVGCPVGCRFCASGLDGLAGNLAAGQIVEQAWRLAQLEGVGRLTNVVFMGMGEPLANFAQVTRAIRTLAAPWGFGISARKITVSTVGLPTAIRKLVEFELPVKLALSLHAPNDELRRRLIPWAEYATIAELVDACDAYFASTGREITFEYLLLRGVNDRPHHAEELAEVAKRTRANVNLIRYNEVRSLPYERPATEDVRRFQDILRARRVNVHIRASRGRDIAAACGQLRRETPAAR